MILDQFETHKLQIRSLLGSAQHSANQVGTDVSFKRPDRAYIEYLISTELLFNIIPKHKDYPSLIASRTESQNIYRSLCKVSDLAVLLASPSPLRDPTKVLMIG